MGAGKESLRAGQEMVACDRAGGGDGDSTERWLLQGYLV